MRYVSAFDKAECRHLRRGSRRQGSLTPLTMIVQQW